MPRWERRINPTLYYSDCFIFPLPEPFLNCTLKTEESTLGLIVNRVKQDIDGWPLNPHWASSEEHTWLMEWFTVLWDSVLWNKVALLRILSKITFNHSGYQTVRSPDWTKKSPSTRKCQSGVAQWGRQTLKAGNDPQEAGALWWAVPNTGWQVTGRGVSANEAHSPSLGWGTFLKGFLCDTVTSALCPLWNLWSTWIHTHSLFSGHELTALLIDWRVHCDWSQVVRYFTDVFVCLSPHYLKHNKNQVHCVHVSL